MKTFIREYKKFCGKRLDVWLEELSKLQKLKDVIHLAATANNTAGKKHDHQWRISNDILAHFDMKLQTVQNKIKKCTQFDELYDLIETNKIKGIGKLTVYDTALRIGTHLKFYPDKIYLHNGTKTGAQNLLSRSISERWITVMQLPAELQKSGLSAYHLENFLCIYKDYLGRNPTITLDKKNPCKEKSKPDNRAAC